MGDFLLGEVSEEPGSLRVPAGEIRERAAAKPKRMGRADVRVSQLAIESLGHDSEGEDEDDSSDTSLDDGLQMRNKLPPGWAMTVRTSVNGRKYNVFKGPQGARQMQSLPAAWTEHDRLVGAESDDESVSGLEVDSGRGLRMGRRRQRWLEQSRSCRLRQNILKSRLAAAARRGVHLNTDTMDCAPAWLWFQGVDDLSSSTLMDWLRGVRRLGWGSLFRLLVCVAGSGVVFEDRFFCFLQE